MGCSIETGSFFAGESVVKIEGCGGGTVMFIPLQRKALGGDLFA